MGTPPESRRAPSGQYPGRPGSGILRVMTESGTRLPAVARGALVFADSPRSHWFSRAGKAGFAFLALGGLASALPTPPAPPPQAVAPQAASAALAASLRPPVSPAAALPGGKQPVVALPADEAVRLNASRLPDGVLEKVPSFRFGLGNTERMRAVECLSAAAYYEAGDDPVGQRAVIQVVLNRTRHPSYPKSVCGVVFEGSTRKTGCQFTFTCDGSLARVPSTAAWNRARALALAALDGAVDPSVGAATHYHANYVLPYWAPRLEKLTQIGAHIFYRFPGSWGRAAVLTKGGSRAEPEVPSLARLSPFHAPSAEAAALAIGTTAVLPGNRQVSASNPLTTPAPLPAGGPIMLAVEPRGAPGRWATEALSRCRGRSDCQVIAWGSQWQVNANTRRSPEARDRPLFLFVRDKASGMEVALWDCFVTPRAANECLPEDPAALRRLMRERG